MGKVRHTLAYFKKKKSVFWEKKKQNPDKAAQSKKLHRKFSAAQGWSGGSLRKAAFHIEGEP